jgi:uncharacterized protein (DUF1800 family)
MAFSMQRDGIDELQQMYWLASLELQSERKAGPLRDRLSIRTRQLRNRIVSMATQACLKDLLNEKTLDLGWQRWFWFNHFNVHSIKGHIAPVLQSYEQDAIAGTLSGRFSDLLKAVTVHPAMLIYLDNIRNLKGQGNENHARELLELHTLGVDGGYTQTDVSATAKVLTGWSVQLRGNPERLGRTVFNATQHEMGTRQVLGRNFADAGEDTLPALLEHLATLPATARHVSRRLCLWTLGQAGLLTEEVDRVTAVYMETGGRLSSLWAECKRLSRERQRDLGVSAWQGPFKDPLRYLTSAVALIADGRAIEDVRAMERWLRVLGQPLYLRASPDGYPLGADEWLNAGQLAQRIELAREIVTSVPRMVARPDAGGLRRHKPDLAEARIQSLRLSPRTQGLIRQVSDPVDAWALVLASPEFMYGQPHG